MSKENEIVLSILIVSHNQKELLCRCMHSVLKQTLPFRYEIIISDDCSTDGTWELIEEYVKQFAGIVKGVQSCLTGYNVTCSSERCGCNRLTAYLNSSGKYFVNLDADDYLVGTDVYKKSVEKLEQHPECSMCYHRVWYLKDGEEWGNGFSVDYNGYQDGDVIGLKRAILEYRYDVNPGYVIRRQNAIDMKTKLGKYFNDTPVTLLHFFYGPAIFLDSYGYVYVQYNNSIFNSSSKQQRAIQNKVDPFMLIQQIPELAGLLIKRSISMLPSIWKRRYRYSRERLPDGPKMSYADFEGFIFDYYQNGPRSIFSIFRAFFLRCFFSAIKILDVEINNPQILKFFYALNTSWAAANKIPPKCWIVK